MSDDMIFVICTCAVVAGVVFAICFMFGMDKRQERLMSEKGYCYQQAIPGVPGSWQYQKCK